MELCADFNIMSVNAKYAGDADAICRGKGLFSLFLSDWNGITLYSFHFI